MNLGGGGGGGGCSGAVMEAGSLPEVGCLCTRLMIVSTCTAMQAQLALQLVEGAQEDMQEAPLQYRHPAAKHAAYQLSQKTEFF